MSLYLSSFVVINGSLSRRPRSESQSVSQKSIIHEGWEKPLVNRIFVSKYEGGGRSMERKSDGVCIHANNCGGDVCCKNECVFFVSERLLLLVAEQEPVIPLRARKLH